jgi:ADP-heptose:LPS heptosyltransferase
MTVHGTIAEKADRYNQNPAKQRLLIYRHGSIGDFVVSLPCLYAIRRAHPGAEITLLTNSPINARAAPASKILENTSLVDKYLFYSSHETAVSRFFQIREQVKVAAHELVIYLTEARDLFSTYRDFLFFRSCGVRTLIGFPFAKDLRTCRQTGPTKSITEREAKRLARCLLHAYGEIDIDDPSNWSLQLSKHELSHAQSLMEDSLPGYTRSRPLLGVSIGTKQKINDWGFSNWCSLLEGLHGQSLSLVFIGGKEDNAASAELGNRSNLPFANFCGALDPRLSAAVMKYLSLLVCHDSGPMHLAASVGTRCLAIFSRKNPAGMWFPMGKDHSVFYPEPNCEIGSIEPSCVLRDLSCTIANLDKQFADGSFSSASAC